MVELGVREITMEHKILVRALALATLCFVLGGCANLPAQTSRQPILTNGDRMQTSKPVGYSGTVNFGPASAP